MYFPWNLLHLVQGSATTSHAAKFGFSDRKPLDQDHGVPMSRLQYRYCIGYWISITNNHFAILEYWCLHWLNWLKKYLYFGYCLNVMVIGWVSHWFHPILKGKSCRDIGHAKSRVEDHGVSPAGCLGDNLMLCLPRTKEMRAHGKTIVDTCWYSTCWYWLFTSIPTVVD